MTAMDRALKYLNIKPRTRAQVERYLQSKDHTEEEIAAVISELEEYHYVDDLVFSRMYIELGFEKGRGIARIRRELAEKGVDRDTIAKAIDELDDMPDEYERALEIGKNVVSGMDFADMDFKEKQKIQARIARRLAGRGYTADIAYRVAKECTSD